MAHRNIKKARIVLAALKARSPRTTADLADELREELGAAHYETLRGTLRFLRAEGCVSSQRRRLINVYSYVAELRVAS